MNDLIDVIKLKYQELSEQGFFIENESNKRKSLDVFQKKYNKSFIEKFSINEIRQKSGYDLLEFLFQPMSDFDIGLSVAMERFMKEFGSFTGTDYDKSPVSYSKAKVDKEFPNEAWRIYGAKRISEEDAIKIAEITKETLLELYNFLLNEDFDTFYEKMPNDRYYRFYHKYFYIFFPKYLTSFHSKDFAPNLKEKLNLHLYNKLELEKFFYESFTKFDSTINNDDLRLTIEEIWGKGIKATEYKKSNKNTEDFELNILSVEQNNEKEKDMPQQPKNQILYGPPGTGKTYNTVVEAMRIIEPQNFDNEGNLKGEYKDLKNKFDDYKKQGRIEFVTFHQSYSYEEFVEGIKPDLQDKNNLKYIKKKGVFKVLCDKAESNKEPHVLIIDEINRGNISKIFGELITLIEDDKRLGEANEVTVKLPYAEEDEQAFGVPSNLYIIGTMNTSDRSIASVDIALRRRFKFKEMMPDVELIKKNDNTSVWDILGDKKEKLYSVNLKELLETLNRRITILLDRDHQIGHSYFLDLIKDENGEIKENLTETELKEMWFSCIQPLLNEYFYGDWEKLQALLGKAEENDESFIQVIKNDCLLNAYSCDTEELCDFTHKGEIKFMNALIKAFKNTISVSEKPKVENDANSTT